MTRGVKTGRMHLRGERRPPAHGLLHDYEIDVGYSVPADWNTFLVEPWAERKARRAAERTRAAS